MCSYIRRRLNNIQMRAVVYGLEKGEIVRKNGGKCIFLAQKQKGTDRDL